MSSASSGVTEQYNLLKVGYFLLCILCAPCLQPLLGWQNNTIFWRLATFFCAFCCSMPSASSGDRIIQSSEGWLLPLVNSVCSMPSASSIVTEQYNLLKVGHSFLCILCGPCRQPLLWWQNNTIFWRLATPFSFLCGPCLQVLLGWQNNTIFWRLATSFLCILCAPCCQPLLGWQNNTIFFRLVTSFCAFCVLHAFSLFWSDRTIQSSEGWLLPFVHSVCSMCLQPLMGWQNNTIFWTLAARTSHGSSFVISQSLFQVEIGNLWLLSNFVFLLDDNSLDGNVDDICDGLERIIQEAGALGIALKPLRIWDNLWGPIDKDFVCNSWSY